jgi:glycosyltransferase involved in cell wall biosynthesis
MDPLRLMLKRVLRSGRVLGVPSTRDSVLEYANAILGLPRPRISVVIPTVGRATLARAVESARWADEVIVVYDAATIPCAVPHGVQAFAIGPTGHWGSEQREFGIREASGTHIAFIDDDDVYTPAAGRAIRRAVAARPRRVHVFKMRDAEREYGGRGSLAQGSIGSPMFVVPRDGSLGSWSTRYEGDYDFIRSTLERRGDRPCFHDELIALVRPGEPPRRKR